MDVHSNHHFPMTAFHTYHLDYQEELLKTYMDQFTRIGFEIEEFGSSSFKISEVPLMFANINFEKFINSFLHTS